MDSYNFKNICRGDDGVKKIRNGLLILSGLVVLIAVIFIVRYLLADEPLWESPYDKELIDQKIVLDLSQDNLDLLLLQVGEYVEKWTGQQRLISCSIYVNNMGINRRYRLVYDIGSIDDYVGVCEVECYFEDEKWVVESAENRYTQDGNAEKTALHIQEVQEKYEAGLAIMRDNDFWKGTDCLLLIRADMASVTVFGTNEKTSGAFLKE